MYFNINQSCKYDSNGFIKKLEMIDKDLKRTILIDNSKIAVKFNESNFLLFKITQFKLDHGLELTNLIMNFN